MTIKVSKIFYQSQADQSENQRQFCHPLEMFVVTLLNEEFQLIDDLIERLVLYSTSSLTSARTLDLSYLLESS